MRRVTADSNILISALRYGGKPLTLLELALAGRVELFVSDEILEETLGLLRDKFKRASEELAGDRAYIEACTVRVVSTERLHVVPDDEDDNCVLERAVAGDCECVLTALAPRRIGFARRRVRVSRHDEQGRCRRRVQDPRHPRQLCFGEGGAPTDRHHTAFCPDRPGLMRQRLVICHLQLQRGKRLAWAHPRQHRVPARKVKHRCGEAAMDGSIRVVDVHAWSRFDDNAALLDFNQIDVERLCESRPPTGLLHHPELFEPGEVGADILEQVHANSPTREDALSVFARVSSA